MCRCRKHYSFPYAGKNGEIFICTRFGLWAQIARKYGFCWGHVGLVVFFFQATSLGPKPSLLLLVCFSFFLFLLVLVCFENHFQFLPSFLLSLPFSLSLSVSPLLLFFLSSFLVFFLFCFLVLGLVPSCARNMRKGSAKCVFPKKITQKSAAPNGVHLCTHDFVPHFFLFLFPLFSGATWFLLWNWSIELPKTREGGRVWPFFPANAGFPSCFLSLPSSASLSWKQKKEEKEGKQQEK